jgi:hypothetical protein
MDPGVAWCRDISGRAILALRIVPHEAVFKHADRLSQLISMMAGARIARGDF